MKTDDQTSLTHFADRLADYFSCHNVYLFSKGRIALYAALKAMGIGEGDDVLLPGYTCVVVPAAIKRLGARPVYADVDEATYNLSLNSLKEKITPACKAVLLQHTYGIPCDAGPIIDWASAHSLRCLEDCCHALGSTYKGRLCGTLTEAAFLSGQWNKPFTTGLGGMLVVNNPELDAAVRPVYETIDAPRAMMETRLRIQQILYRYAVNPRSVMAVTSMYRFASSAGVMIGSSSDDELCGEFDPKDILRMARCQASLGLKQMNGVQRNIEHRKTIAAFYREALSEFDSHPTDESLAGETVFLRYPLRVSNKSNLLNMAYRKSREIGTWFESPLHPLNKKWELFDYQAGSCPVSERLSQETINLPTHPGISLNEAEAIVRFIHHHSEPAQSHNLSM